MGTCPKCKLSNIKMTLTGNCRCLDCGHHDSFMQFDLWGKNFDRCNNRSAWFSLIYPILTICFISALVVYCISAYLDNKLLKDKETQQEFIKTHRETDSNPDNLWANNEAGQASTIVYQFSFGEWMKKNPSKKIISITPYYTDRFLIIFENPVSGKAEEARHP